MIDSHSDIAARRLDPNQPLARCPWCGAEDCEAEFVHVGIGYQQVDAFHCHRCGAVEIGADASGATAEEKDKGWYAPFDAKPLAYDANELPKPVDIEPMPGTPTHELSNAEFARRMAAKRTNG